MKRYVVVCIILCFAFISFGQVDTTLNNIHAKYCVGYSEEQIYTFDQKVNKFVYSYKEPSVDNLISTFGIEYFDLSFVDARQVLNNAIASSLRFDGNTYEDSNDRVSNLFDTLGTGQIIYSEEQIWDELLQYDFPTSPHEGTWTYSHSPRSQYNYVSEIETGFDSTLNVMVATNADSIVSEIGTIAHPRLRRQVYFLFLQNLFVKELDKDLAFYSYKFIYDILYENGQCFKNSLIRRDISFWSVRSSVESLRSLKFCMVTLLIYMNLSD